MTSIIATRTYLEEDQREFAAWSGDFNPMHVDPVAARRTGAGAPVVHGVHNLLWCLDAIGRTLPHAGPIHSLRANFDSFVTIGEPIDAILVSHDAAKARAEIRVRGTLAVTIVLGFGDKRAALPEPAPETLYAPEAAVDLPPGEVATLAGRMPYASDNGTQRFPHAARMLGARRVEALGAYTRLVGMLCPGLHSIFNKLALDAADDDGAAFVSFRTQSVVIEHRYVVQKVWGGGWMGNLTTTMRHRPAAQPSMADLAALLRHDACAAWTALVVGGSRGIGEVSAKLIAAAGGTVIVTYASGAADAARVAAEIGPAASILKLDVTAPIAKQVAGITPVTHMLYFATPMIGARRDAVFEPERLAIFTRFYIEAFYELCSLLLAAAKPLVALYPSTVYVADRPAGLVEYAMAKAAGETLCADMGALAGLRVVVNRLPRLATDQNPGLTEAPDVAETMLPILRAMGAAESDSTESEPASTLV